MAFGRSAGRSTPLSINIYWLRLTISHCYWHLVVKNGNFTFLLISSVQEWQFHIAGDMYWSKNGSFTLLLTCSGKKWHFHTATDIQWWGMAILHCYRHVVIKNGNFTLLLTSSESRNGNFIYATDMYWIKNCSFKHWCWCLVVKNGNFTLLLMSSGQE